MRMWCARKERKATESGHAQIVRQGPLRPAQQTLIHSAANDCIEPKVPNAADPSDVRYADELP